MNYIVLDLEWNMGSKREELKVMPFEIIEIGAVRLDPDRKETGRFSRLIHPRVYRKMHWANKSIFHLENSDLKDADDFEMVYSEFLAFCGDEPYIFCTWGDTDLTELQRNIYYFDCLPISEGPLEFLDIQKLNGYNEGAPKNRISLEKAVEEYSIEENEGFHRAVNDAVYTAEVLRHIDKKYEVYTSFNTYHVPASPDSEIFRDYGSYVKYISRCFPAKSVLLHDKKVKSLKCPVCGAKLEKSLPLFSLNNKHYFTMGICKDHGAVKSKIRIKKEELQGLPYAVKTTRLIDHDEKESLKQKYQKSISSKSE
ncbi:MAG: exonuclease domain-containing protein [Lachnospiraceae bacterium]|nr:exonuclease domain-containing protein [Lachnospiraceae bacterium]